jgi:two-component system KDP operon response regulator KdpE
MRRPIHVLLVDDDVRLVGLLADRLRRDGFEVTVAFSGREAIAALEARWPDLVLLDLMLPDMAGEDVAGEVKRRADLPIVVLSAVDEPEAKVELIARYSEDYVTKPFHYPELAARINRIVRRLYDRIPAQELVLGPDLTLILRKRTAVVAGRPVRLSPTELRVLETLTGSLGETVSTDILINRVWGRSDRADPAYAWVTIRRLRQKIEIDPDHPRYLRTDPRGGYRLERVVDPATEPVEPAGAAADER